MPKIISHTSQLIEPVRIDIGKMLVAHELFKLFPKLGDYDQVKDQINNRWVDFSNVVTIRDFWNLVDSLMIGLRLKNIVPLITTQKIEWKLEREYPIDKVRFTWDKEIKGYKFNKKTATEVIKYLEEHKDVLKHEKVKTQAAYSNASSRGRRSCDHRKVLK